MMKQLIFIVVLTIAVIMSCSINVYNMQDQDSLTLPKVDDKFEKFDVDRFMVNKDSISSYFNFRNDSIYQEQHHVRQSYGVYTYYHSSYFMIIKSYFNDGGIKEKGISFIDGYPVGIWYTFNKEGQLIERTNMDAGYEFSWKDVIEYCISQDIKLPMGYTKKGEYKTKVYKEGDEAPYKNWKIRYKSDVDKITTVTLDSKTGKEINREVINYLSS